MPTIRPSDLLSDLLATRRRDREHLALQLSAIHDAAERCLFATGHGMLNVAHLLVEAMQRRTGEEVETNAVYVLVPGGAYDLDHLRRQTARAYLTAERGQFKRAHGELNGVRAILIHMTHRAEHPGQETP